MKKLLLALSLIATLSGCTADPVAIENSTRVFKSEDKMANINLSITNSYPLYHYTPGILSFAPDAYLGVAFSKGIYQNDFDQYYLDLEIMRSRSVIFDLLLPKIGKSLIVYIDGKKYELELHHAFKLDAHTSGDKYVLIEKVSYTAPKELLEDVANLQSSIEFTIYGNKETLNFKKEQFKLHDYARYNLQAYAKKILAVPDIVEKKSEPVKKNEEIKATNRNKNSKNSKK